VAFSPQKPNVSKNCAFKNYNSAMIIAAYFLLKLFDVMVRILLGKLNHHLHWLLNYAFTANLKKRNNLLQYRAAHRPESQYAH